MPAKRPPVFDLARLREGLKPFRLHFFPTVGSTNTHAAALRRRGDLFAPAVLLTPRQTAGRGRGSNTWFSRAGNLTVTFALPVEQHLLPHQLPLVVGLAVRQAAAELSGTPDILLKWPNDLVTIADCGLRIADLKKRSAPSSQSAIRNPQSAMKKLAGLLCERVDNVDLIGLGLNVNLDPRKSPKSLRDKLTSLREIAGHDFDLTDVVITVARHLRRTLSSRNSQLFPSFLQEYDRRHALVGRTVTILGQPDEPAITGRCLGLDDMGRLLVKDRRTTHHVIAGHVLAR